MKPGRIPCEVPFCRRTADAKKYPEGTRIICHKHFRLGDDRPRRTYRHAKRKFRKTGIERYRDIMHNCWERVRRQAIERAAGIT